MSGERFITSDTHFGWKNACEQPDRFTNRLTGGPLRPWRTADEMDEELIANWNATVRPGDTVYHLGDVAIPHKALALVDRLHGRKILVRGNHDIYKMKDYYPRFVDIRGMMVKDWVVFAHAPIHPASISPRFRGCVHGHLHADFVRLEKFDTAPDPRYACVSVEMTAFRPVAFDDVMARFPKKEFPL